MLGPTTTLQDVLYGLYNWLIEHPSETVLVSVNHESGSNTLYDKKFEELLFAGLNNEVAKKFWLQTSGEVGSIHPVMLPDPHPYVLILAGNLGRCTWQTHSPAEIHVSISRIFAKSLRNTPRRRSVDPQWRRHEADLQPGAQARGIYSS
jgi:hypothetical protein